MRETERKAMSESKPMFSPWLMLRKINLLVRFFQDFKVVSSKEIEGLEKIGWPKMPRGEFGLSMGVRSWKGYYREK